ncbi:MAG TPA: SCP2 sterol-binding domain-containing protein [Thermoplasmata archaeon]|nr:SCP2 sterol-binding domain-containing protein [Thermoplasmata archaeon]
MKDLLDGLVAKFNAKVDGDAGLRDELVGVTKTVLIELKDGTKYHFVLKDSKLSGVQDGGVEHPDVAIITDTDTLRGLLLREIGPWKAYAMGKIRLKGNLEDLARFRKFF